MTGPRLVHEVLRTGELRVAEFALPAGSCGPWHLHSEVGEVCHALRGSVRIEAVRAESVLLASGSSVNMEAGRLHRVLNRNENEARFLVLQGPGRFDFIAREPES